MKKTNVTKKKNTGASKKTTRKVPVRKAPAKKSSSSRTRKKRLVIAPPETAFFAVNGAVLYSLLDLYNELATMSDEEFSFHAGDESNHFANWVRDVVKDKSCAKDLQSANTRRKARSVVKKYLVKYSY
ncbi:MAG: hypothetical protein U5L75_01715 [Candidatus Campbellbacteria bacterium]|nr:hypothetical protein [Candidatus Campbellbacteria bacterium]